MNTNITISGTDPTNPRCAGHIAERLTQMERDLKAMYEEAGRLCVFAGRIRDVLREEQGLSDHKATARAQAAVLQIGTLRERLGEGAVDARRSRDALSESGVNMRASFAWTPSR